MKIELKRDSFKILFDYLNDNKENYCPPIKWIIAEELKPQYNKAFKQYNEMPKFKLGQEVINVWGSNNKEYNLTDLEKIEKGKIVKITKDTNGRIWYHVKYKIDNYDDDGDVVGHTDLTYKFRDKFLKLV